jgi:hypothetical protein
MEQIIIRILLFIYLLGATACTYWGYSTSVCLPKSIEETFTLCYSGDSTSIREVLNIDGYFRIYRRSKPSGMAMILYDDGTLIAEAFSGKPPEPDMSDFEFFLSEVCADSTGKARRRFNTAFCYGLYEIRGDTLVTQVANWPDIMAGFRSWEEHFIIINRNNIQHSYYRQLGPEHKKGEKRFLYEEELRFVPFNCKPKAYIWFKEFEWFHCP